LAVCHSNCHEFRLSGFSGIRPESGNIGYMPPWQRYACRSKATHIPGREYMKNRTKVVVRSKAVSG